MMYRSLLPLLVYIGAGSAAPQAQDTLITYIQPPTEQLAVENQTVLRESRIEKLPLTIPGKVEDAATETADLPTTTTEYFTTETSTTIKPTPTTLPVKYTRKLQPLTKIPRYYSKLSYFKKPSEISVATNLIDDLRVGKRGWVSKCRCEKIWNCPVLQQSVHRCPDEFFLCCFN